MCVYDLLLFFSRKVILYMLYFGYDFTTVRNKLRPLRSSLVALFFADNFWKIIFIYIYIYIYICILIKLTKCSGIMS